MKKIRILIIILNIFVLKTNAQDTIPNANFEQYTYYTGMNGIKYIHPNFWQRSDSIVLDLFGYKHNLFKPFEGNYSVIEYADVLNRPTYVYQKFTYSERPKTFTMQVFFDHVTNNEHHCVEIIFEKNNSIISYNKSLSESIYYNTYKDTNSFCYPYLMAVPISFNTSDTPDYCTIKIWSANCDSGSYHLPLNRVIVDDLKFHKDSVSSSKYVNAGIGEINQSKNNGNLKLIPNPSGQFCKLYYSLKEASPIEISIYDIQGKLVKSILNQNQSIGDYNVNIETANLQDGIYFVMIRVNGVVASERLVVQQ